MTRVKVVSAMTATLTLNICISAIKGYPGEMSGAGLVILGHLGVSGHVETCLNLLRFTIYFMPQSTVQNECIACSLLAGYQLLGVRVTNLCSDGSLW